MTEQQEQKRYSQARAGRSQGGPAGHVGSFEKPKNASKALTRVLQYLGKDKGLLILVIFLLLLNTGTSLAGSYFLKPMINTYILPGDLAGLGTALLQLAGIYLVGVVSALLQSRLMVRIAQKATNTLRRDLFDKLQTLPLRFFDANTHGELMKPIHQRVDNVHRRWNSLPSVLFQHPHFRGCHGLDDCSEPHPFPCKRIGLVLLSSLPKKSCHQHKILP
jgi:ATP-binding cassette subfamily B protein